MAKMGRPTKYSEELVDRMCDEIAKGRSVREICEEDWAVHRDTFFLWLYKHPYFSDKYAKAKAAQQESEAERILDIADDASPEDVQVARLRVDARKWTMARLAPKRFGDRIGVDGQQTVIVKLDPEAKDL